MKPLDFNKPVRFSGNKNAVHYVGIDAKGNRVFHNPMVDAFFKASDNGESDDHQTIENVPEKIVRWICVMPDSGFPTKEEAAKIAALDHRYSMIRIEFEDGQRP
jgi:hypothetical protein